MSSSGPSYDLGVVGGGIIGVMTALLARRRHPELRIVLLDRSVAGTGATAYSAFLDLPFGVSEGVRRLSRRSRQLYQELRSDLPGLPIRDVEMFGICESGAVDSVLGRLSLPGSRQLSRAAGEPGATIPATPEHFVVPPGFSVLAGMTATRCVDASLLDCLLGALESTPRTHLIEGAEVERIATNAGGHELQLADGRSLHAGKVALCLGPWLATTLERLAGVRAELRIKKVVSLLLPSAPAPEAPVVYLFEHDAFLMPQPERRRWLFSFRSEEWDCLPNQDTLRLSRADLESATRVLDLYLPGGHAAPVGARVFCDGYTPSRDPIVMPIANRPGMVAAGGPGGSGVRLAPAIAERALELIGL